MVWMTLSSVRLLPGEPKTLTLGQHRQNCCAVLQWYSAHLSPPLSYTKLCPSLPVPPTFLRIFYSKSTCCTHPIILAKRTLPAAHSASSVFPQSYRIHRQWAWPALTQCGPARSSDCPCSYPAAARPPGSPWASSPCGQRSGHSKSQWDGERPCPVLCSCADMNDGPKARFPWSVLAQFLAVVWLCCMSCFLNL